MLLYPSRVVVTGFHPHGHPGVDKYHGKNQYFLCCPSRSRVMFTRFACRRSAGQFNNTINISKNLCGIEDGKVRPEGFPMPVSVPAASMLYRCGTALFVLYPDLFFEHEQKCRISTMSKISSLFRRTDSHTSSCLETALLLSYCGGRYLSRPLFHFLFNCLLSRPGLAC